MINNTFVGSMGTDESRVNISFIGTILPEENPDILILTVHGKDDKHIYHTVEDMRGCRDVPEVVVKLLLNFYLSNPPSNIESDGDECKYYFMMSCDPTSNGGW